MLIENLKSTTYCIIGIQSTEIMTKNKTKNRPTISFSFSEGFCRILGQISTVKIVEAELKTEVKEDIRAAIITANTSPVNPEKNSYIDDK